MDKTSSPNIQSNPKRLCVALLLGALWLASCGAPKFEPVEIAAEDMCAFCKMAISEKQYAAEFLNQDGDAFKFDDIGCLANQLKTVQNRRNIAAFFIMDYDARQWVNAEQAYFVRSDGFRTPMSGRVVAFKDRSKAEEAAAKYHGRLLSFDEAFGEAGK
ncbi:MAG TPA: nitrous oxide reductase accessory protein NosL [Blastocatellia bacterium]|nr:nitrous oxide reductase accessory protein NosL [Blastocatellia bacterium]